MCESNNLKMAFCLILSVALGYQSHLYSLYKHQRELIEKHTFPDSSAKEQLLKLLAQPHIQKAFEEKDNNALKAAGFTLHNTWGNIIAQHPRVEGWVIKAGERFVGGSNNVRRVEKAELIRNSIARAHLENYITVPEKYLLHIPGKGQELLNKNYLVLAKKLDLADASVSTLPNSIIRKTCRVIRNVGMCDARTENVRLTKDGKVAFIDTEPFLEPDVWWWQAIEGLGIRRIKGAIGAQIFRQSVARERFRARLASKQVPKYIHSQALNT